MRLDSSTNNVIVPIRPRSNDELRALVDQVNQRADLVEIWLDRFQPVETPWQGVSTSVQFLGVCKTEAEGGTFTGTPEEKKNILHQFLENGGDFIDLDITHNPPHILQSFPPQNLFLSFHDFTGVPGNLDEIFTQMQTYQPHVYKFAVTTNTTAELEQFMTFVHHFPDELNAIFTTMGALGREGRDTIETSQKSWAQFVALDTAHRTATGQKTLED